MTALAAAWRALTRRGRRAACAFAFALAAVTAAPTAHAERAEPGDAVAERMRVVDCLLPGQVRKIGKHMTFMTKRRPARLAAGECEIRGGEYVAYDRADLNTSLAVWMPLALEGDAKAQLYVGELVERGPSGAPDFAMAKMWYERAAAQGEAAAMFNLGRLYEDGLGVAPDQNQAAQWYAQAYGFEADAPGSTLQIVRRDELDAYQATIAQSATQIAALKTSVAELRRERDDAAAQSAALEAEMARRDAALRESEDAVAQVTAELAAARREHAQAIAAYRTALEQASQAQAALAPERAAVSDETQKLEDRVRTLTRLRDSISADIVEELATLEALRADTDALRADRAALAQDRTRLEALSDEQRALAAANREEAAALERTRRTLDQKLAALAERQNALATREAALADTLAADAARDTAAVRTERTAIRTEQAALATSRAALNADMAELNERLAAASQRERELAALQKQADERFAALTARETALAEAERALADRARELAAADDAKRAAIRAAQDMQLKLEEELAAAQADRGAVAARRVALEARARELATAEATLTARAARLDAETKTLARREDDVSARETRAAELETAARQAEEKLQALQAIILGNQRALSTQDAEPRPAAAKRRRLRIDFGEYHAILIGNANYGDPDWPDLDTPHNDVQRIDEILRERYGFRTTVLLDASREDILLAIETAASKLDEDDNLLIYYAGHGKYSADAQTGFWEPVDSIAYAYRRSISAQDINFYLSTIKARKVLVVSDSCYSGAFTRDLVEIIDDQDWDSREKYFMMLASKKSRVVMTAGGLQPVPDGLGNGHSLFARAFINALVDNDDIALARDLYGRIHDVVVNNAIAARLEQEPLYADMVHSGHEGGDFIFVPRTG